MLAQGHSGGCGHNLEQSNHINVHILLPQSNREDRQVRKKHKNITHVRNTTAHFQYAFSNSWGSLKAPQNHLGEAD